MEHLIKPAIIAIGYNRPASLSRLLCSIARAEYKYDEITLIISIDFWEKDNPCYKIAEGFKWEHGEKIVIKHKENLGLRRHVLYCGDLSEKYEAVILLEDDIVVSEQFYNYTVAACAFYHNKNEVVGIGLYTHHYNGFAQIPFYPIKNGYDSYYGRWVITWGECFCKGQWKAFKNWYERNKEKQLFCTGDIPNQIKEWSDSSWSKYLYPYMLETNTFFALPYEPYATNYADVGDHVKHANNVWQTTMQRGSKEYDLADNKSAVKYDMYFENMDIERFLKVLNLEGNICIDLNGEKEFVEGYDYCLSVQILPYRVIQSFALQVKPIEENVFYNISGNEIFLYDLKQSYKVSKKEQRKQKYKIERYYYPALQYRRMLNYMFFETIKKLNINIIRGWKKILNKRYYLKERCIIHSSSKRESIGNVWMFHQVSETIDFNAGKDYWISTEAFEKLIIVAIQNKLKFKAVQELENTDKKSIFITFDDGYSGIYNNAYPVLKKYNIPFCIFITLNYINRPGYITLDQLKELKNDKLCMIGAHTISHPKLRELKKQDAEWEILHGKEKLQELLNKKIDFIAYPYGNVAAVSKRDVRLAKKAGYQFAFSTLQTSLKLKMLKKPFFIARWNVNEKNALEIVEKY